MRIAYLSPYSPENIHYWSGAPHHIYKILQQYHDVKWIGEGMLSGAFWHHRYLDSPEVFYPEYYQREMGRVLSETINADNFDIVLTSYSLFCTYLEVNIPIIAFSDVTFYLYKDFFTNKNTQYHQIAIDTEKRCLERVDAMLYASEWAKADSIRSYNIDPNKLI